MVREELEIVIDKQGQVVLHVKGAPGARCADVTRELEKRLGLVVSVEYTSEFYEQEQLQEIEVGR